MHEYIVCKEVKRYKLITNKEKNQNALPGKFNFNGK